MSDLLLEATGIAKHYGAVVALRNASLAVRPGEIHALMGANGAGKSTLVKILTGAVRPDAGTILISRRVARHPFADGGATQRSRVGLPGAGVHPGPRRPGEPDADRYAPRTVPEVGRRARRVASRPQRVSRATCPSPSCGSSTLPRRSPRNPTSSSSTR